MKVRYTPSNQGGSSIKNSLAAIFFTVLLFAVLPLLQFAKEIDEKEPPIAPTIITDPPPISFTEELPPEVEEEKKVEPPKLEKNAPDIDLTQLEILIERGGSGHGQAVAFADGLEEFIDTELPFDLDDLDRRPQALRQIRPVYPYALKQQMIEGWAIIEWIINPNGTVRSAKIIRSSLSDFGKSATEAILKSKWKPGEKAGKAVATRARQKFNFTL